MGMVPEYPSVFWVLAVFSAMTVGVTKAGFGGGIGIIATPMLALAIPVADSAAIMLPLLITGDIFSVAHYRTRFDRRSVCLLLPGSLFGIAAGAAFFGYFMNNERVLQVGLGILSMIFIAFQVGRAMITGILEKRRPHAIEGVLVGAISGFTSTIVHAGGPPVAIYLLPQKLKRDLFVGTTVVFFAALNQIKLIPYIGLNLLRMEHVMTILFLAPVCFIGVRLGVYLNKRFSELWFNRVVYSVLFLTGVQLLLGKNILSLFVE